MQTTASSIHQHPAKPPQPQTYSPSVPLYVYRELATELKLTQAKLDVLTSQNHQLEEENQLLREEISKVIQSVLHLQKLIDSSPQRKHNQVNHVTHQIKTPPQESSPRPSVVKQTRPDPHFSAPQEINHPTMPETYLIEEEQVKYSPGREKEVKEFSGWWLAMTIVLIMLTAFGAGYLIVRPLFEHQR
ncbi:hypothetical protein NWP17_06925 [Chrysosporum bergii ANA360D]|jgi:hypothetical protein|uniref:Uncharacterized protein n=1 Tax=Chrysosporum bergii ANA360D TaxID=617107 RepID=A0AA43GRE3_9CYAN|nr:hypothetical protein [Chrysosporum bergii]MDH6060170.1 hypothetical protein [Chrysosporum bergii ANA360D]